MQFLAFIIAYPFLWFLSILPFRIFYWISDIVYFVIYYIIRYRKETWYDTWALQLWPNARFYSGILVMHLPHRPNPRLLLRDNIQRLREVFPCNRLKFIQAIIGTLKATYA